MIYLEVAVAAPLAATLTYTARAGVYEPGQRLLVPLGGRTVTAYLLRVLPESEGQASPYKLRAISDVLNQTPLFPANMVPFYRWIADYYQYPLGEVIKGALPGGLTTESSRRLILTESGRRHFLALEEAGELPEQPWLAALLAHGQLSQAATRELWRKKEKKQAEKWSAAGWLEIRQELRGDTIKAKMELCARLRDPDPAEATIAALTKPARATWALLKEQTALGGQSWIPRRDLAKLYSGARPALLLLAAAGLIELGEQRVYRDPFGERPPFFPAPKTLTAEQEAVLQPIRAALARHRFAPFLLHGVTGSGKTEVYLQAAATTLAAGRGVLVLVPEIALATQLEGHFLSRFGDQVALLHSGLSDGERFDQWHRIAIGAAAIVIGARSAIFAPLPDPGLIIVDEEHDGAYKQEDNFRYQARDLAILRAQQREAVVILGSATPAITTYYHAQQGKFTLLTMKQRVQNRPLPAVELVDLKTIKKERGQPLLFSPQLLAAIGANLEQGNQTLIFLNRRGYANLMLCEDCGHTVQCRDCNVTLTLHQHRAELVCHYCGFTTRSALICPHCQSSKLIGLGFGTERLELELSQLFPSARLARLDRDTSGSRSKYLGILKAVHQREIDILIGTQMITKGHHFPHVTLVGVIWADAGLGMPDYKASERTFQLLTQVTGRAGRGDLPGRVIVQTHQPEHYSITTARDQDYPALFAREIVLRQALGFPPFGRLINIRLEGAEEEAVKNAANQIAQAGLRLASAQNRIVLLGPAPAPLARLRNLHRWQLLLKGPHSKPLRELAARLLQLPPTGHPATAVKLSVDVDPENML